MISMRLRVGRWVNLGTVFAGTENAFVTLDRHVRRVWKEEFLARGVVNNEQIAMVLLHKTNPELFDLVLRTETCRWFGKVTADDWGYQHFLPYLRGDESVPWNLPRSCSNWW